MPVFLLRDWQQRCREVFRDRLRVAAAADEKPRFRLEACVGAGKSAMMAEFAYQLLLGDFYDDCPIDFAVFVAPSRAITGWHSGADREPAGIIGALERRGIWAMESITGARMPGLMRAPEMARADAGLVGAAAVFTYQYLVQPRVQETLVAWAKQDGRRLALFLDEIHHIPESGTAWADAVSRVASAAACEVYLSGTWFRTDQRAIHGHGGERTQVDFSYGYSDGIEDRIVRPVSFWVKNVTAKIHDQQTGQVIDERPVSEYLEDLPGEVRAKLFDPDGDYVAAMIRDADRELSRRRAHYPDAGCLIVCPPGVYGDADADPEDGDDGAAASIAKKVAVEQDRIATRVCERVTQITGKRAVLVLNGTPVKVLQDYKDGDAEYVVAVNRITEGCDIPRLRMLVVLRDLSRSELLFTQTLGRVIRRRPHDDDEPALVMMPPISQMCEFARSVTVAKNLANPKPAQPCPACNRSPCKCPCDRCGKAKPCKCPCRMCGERPCVCPDVPVDVFVELEQDRDAHIIHATDIEHRHATRAQTIRERVGACAHRDLAGIAFILQVDEAVNGVVATSPGRSQADVNRAAVATGANWSNLRDTVVAKMRSDKFRKLFRDADNPYEAAARHINTQFRNRFGGKRWSEVKDDQKALTVQLLTEIIAYIDRKTGGAR